MPREYENNLTFYEVTPSSPEKAERCIIWLHGLGADGNDFLPIVPELNLPSTMNLSFLFPNAPIIPISVNNGYKMPGWFDIYDMSFERKVDLQGINNSISSIEMLIQQQEKNGISSKNIILAGFSQGAVIALMAGLQYKNKLGGIIALSGYLPFINDAVNHIPVFLAHGTDDTVVPFQLGQNTLTALQLKKLDVSWHSYKMGHAVCPQEIMDISQWIQHIWN